MDNPGSTAVGRARKARPVWAIAFVVALLGAFSLSLGTASRAFADPSNAGGVSIDAGGSGDGGPSPRTSTTQAGRRARTPPARTAIPTSRPSPTRSRRPTGTPTGPWRPPTDPRPRPRAANTRCACTSWTGSSPSTGSGCSTSTSTAPRCWPTSTSSQAAGNAGGDGTYIGVEEDFNETADANGDITIQFLQGSASVPMVNAIAVVPVAVNAGGVSIDSGGSG